MFSKKINTKYFFFRRKIFFNALSSMFLTMRSCCNYTMSSKTCRISNNSKKCVKCVRSNCDYNLTIFSTLIKRIYEERMRLKKEVGDAYTKLSQLKKQLDFLENKKKEMIVTK